MVFHRFFRFFFVIFPEGFDFRNLFGESLEDVAMLSTKRCIENRIMKRRVSCVTKQKSNKSNPGRSKKPSFSAWYYGILVPGSSQKNLQKSGFYLQGLEGPTPWCDKPFVSLSIIRCKLDANVWPGEYFMISLIIMHCLGW